MNEVTAHGSEQLKNENKPLSFVFVMNNMKLCKFTNDSVCDKNEYIKTRNEKQTMESELRLLVCFFLQKEDFL